MFEFPSLNENFHKINMTQNNLLNLNYNFLIDFHLACQLKRQSSFLIHGRCNYTKTKHYMMKTVKEQSIPQHYSTDLV